MRSVLSTGGDRGTVYVELTDRRIVGPLPVQDVTFKGRPLDGETPRSSDPKAGSRGGGRPRSDP